MIFFESRSRYSGGMSRTLLSKFRFIRWISAGEVREHETGDLFTEFPPRLCPFEHRAMTGNVIAASRCRVRFFTKQRHGIYSRDRVNEQSG